MDRSGKRAGTSLICVPADKKREKGREGGIKKEDEERCGGCATHIDVERRRMRNGDDKPADAGRRRGRIGR